MDLNIFKGLENLGLSNLDKLEVFKTEKEKQIDNEKLKKQKIMSSLYDKTIICPVCGRESKIKAVKSSALKMGEKDSDFMIYYIGINPMFYEIIFCNECGYTALGNYFDNIRDNSKAMILQNISRNWKKSIIPEEYDLDFAIQQHKLALLNSVIKEAKASEKAVTCLKTSWLYRLKGDKDNEKLFQEKAVIGFKEAYASEKFPIAGLSEFNILYLMGELNRRLGEDAEALKCFSEILVSKAPEKVKDMAREQKNLIK